MAGAAASTVLGRGSAAWVHYGAGEHHARLVGSLVENDEYAVVSPDFDVYVGQLSLHNGDLEGIRFSASVDVRPRGIPVPGSMLYIFAALTPAEVNELLAEADQVCNLERAHRGLPLLGEAARAPVGAAVVTTPVPAVAPAPGAPRPVPAGGAWVLAEPLVGHDVGEEFTLPAGAAVLGTRALVVIDGGVATFEQLVEGADITHWALARSNFLCDDPRILARAPTERSLVDAVRSMTACTRQAEGLAAFPLQGPAIGAEWVDSVVRDGATSLIDRASKWRRESGVKTRSSTAHEHAILHRAVQLLATVDGLNVKNLIGVELLLRRITLHEEAVAENPEARLHLKRWNAVQSAAQEAVDGLNLLFGCDPQELSVPTQCEGTEAVGGCSPLHGAIHQHLFATIASGMPDHVQTDHASFRELAGANADYEMLACAVEPCDPANVSLPEGQVSPVVLTEFVSPELGRCLDLDNVLADADVAEYRLRHEPVVSYTDVRIRGDEDVRLKFLRSLYDCGILGFCRASKGMITPFFVKKKQGRQRLVLDCRRPEMSSAENMHGLEVPGEASPVFVATGDISFFLNYQCGVPSALSEYFSFEAVDASLAKKWGATSDVRGLSLPDVGEVFPCLLVLPMGWTWSFYIVQALHAELLREAGFSQDLIMSNAWPAPPLSDDPVALPYCDNLTVFGMSRDRVDQRLRELIGVFEGKGFVLHEISWASTSSDILGTAFDGLRRTVRARPKRAWTLRGAHRHAALGGAISGKVLERLLGHYVVEGLNQRPALSVLRASYVFIRDCCWTPRPLWDSVCRELLVRSSLVPLLSGSFGRPRSTSVLATDASGSGWGVMGAGFDREEVGETGRWNERWRYEPLPPSEWAPRRRALAAELDPLVDPVTSDVGPCDLDELGGVPSEFAWRPRAGFPEVPKAVVLGRSWKCWRAGRCRFEEPIGNKEGRAVIKGMSLELRGPSQRRKRRLVLVDNFGVALCFSRGRAAFFGLLQLVRRLAALSFATGAWVALRWIPSESNPADEPPRLFEKLREARAALYEAPAAGAELGGLSSRRAIDLLRNRWNPACELATVGAKGLAAYQYFENLFLEWQRRRGRATDSHDEIEVNLLGYLDELLADNVKLTHAEKTVCGLLYSTLPGKVKSGICALLIYDGERSTALYVEAAFSGSFRPGELLRAKVGDLVKPGVSEETALRCWSLIVAPEERLQPSKTQAFDDTVIFDHPEWLGEVLGSWAAHAADDRELLPLEAVRVARPFKAAASSWASRHPCTSLLWALLWNSAFGCPQQALQHGLGGLRRRARGVGPRAACGAALALWALARALLRRGPSRGALRRAPGGLRASERRALLDVYGLRERLESAAGFFQTKAAKWELARAERTLEMVESMLQEEHGSLDIQQAQLWDPRVYPVPDYLQPAYRKGGVQVAVTGGSGVGKSSFINAIRRTRPRDQGAAKTGITECTRQPKMYTFWPGRAGVFNKLFDQVEQVLRVTASEDSRVVEGRRASSSAELIRTLVKHRDAWSCLDHREVCLQAGDRVLLSGVGGPGAEECTAEVVVPPGGRHRRSFRVRLGCGEVADVSTRRVLGVLAECAIWDLPGVGTPSFPQQTYLGRMGIRHFDLVVLLTASRFTEAEMALVGELERWDVPYFLVRNKTDCDVQSEIDEREQSFEEDDDSELGVDEKKRIEGATIKRIKEFFRTEHDLCSIYCVSSKPGCRMRFDFLRLEHDIEEALRRQRAMLATNLR
ncbi:unnamed protein product [Prorocentrum cordatum]|uniref:IRG-type G domain-containing protein n=1 Tax=Prorocentrum cordatum TaxID=2364126 RepID=A0ABN9TU54_9DINO|nr:unnamed protein product [Polarella glacialis]